jgi:hypothetical protein
MQSRPWACNGPAMGLQTTVGKQDGAQRATGKARRRGRGSAAHHDHVERRLCMAIRDYLARWLLRESKGLAAGPSGSARAFLLNLPRRRRCRDRYSSSSAVPPLPLPLSAAACDCRVDHARSSQPTLTLPPPPVVALRRLCAAAAAAAAATTTTTTTATHYLLATLRLPPPPALPPRRPPHEPHAHTLALRWQPTAPAAHRRYGLARHLPRVAAGPGRCRLSVQGVWRDT